MYDPFVSEVNGEFLLTASYDNTLKVSILCGGHSEIRQVLKFDVRNLTDCLFLFPAVGRSGLDTGARPQGSRWEDHGLRSEFGRRHDSVEFI